MKTLNCICTVDDLDLIWNEEGSRRSPFSDTVENDKSLNVFFLMNNNKEVNGMPGL